MRSILQFFVACFVMAQTFISCSTDEVAVEQNELSGLKKITDIKNETHSFELYSVKGFFEQGYNEISFKIKNRNTNEYVKNAQINWMPIMHMTTMMHSCPFSKIETLPSGTVYKGYIMFQMAQNDTEYWDLKIDYSINDVKYTVSSKVDVPASAKRKVNSFKGIDGTRYLVALIEPNTPKVAVNDLKIGVWKMQDMMSFPVVNGFTVKIDPRMPSMGNHSSPNNVDAIQTIGNDFYHGKLSLTMTGYWVINLQLANPEGNILYGNAITESVPSSSIFFELEF